MSKLAPQDTAPVAIPRALLKFDSDPRGALDDIVRISRALPDGRDTARLIDTALDHLVVPRYATAMPWLNVFRILTEARPPNTSGRTPGWPAAGTHRVVLEKHFNPFWTDALLDLIPRASPPADPDRWMLMSWLETYSAWDETLIPLLRSWAARATGEGRRELAFALTRSVTKRAEGGYNQDPSFIATLLAEEASRLQTLGWVVDAHRARCRLAERLGEPPPPRLRLVARASPDVRDIEQSLLDEASNALQDALFEQSLEPGQLPVLHPRNAPGPLRRVHELWQVAGTLDPARLQSDVPQAVLHVLEEDPALAVQLASFACDAARSRADVPAGVRAMLEALLARARDGASALALGQHLMAVSRGLVACGQFEAALPVGLLARRAALDDIAPWVEGSQRLLASALADVARAAGDGELAHEIVYLDPSGAISL